MSVTTNAVSSAPIFKGSYSKTDYGNTYYKTSAGTTAGAVLAVPAFLLNCDIGGDSKKYANFYRKIGIPEEKVVEFEKKLEKELSSAKKFAMPRAIAAAVCTLGCGMIVDHIRNKKAKEVADLTRQVGVRNAMVHGEGVSISRNGRTYYDSNIGSKYGALLGAGCGVIASGFSILQNKGSETMKEASKLPGYKAALVGGSLFGVAGMLVFIPLTSTIYSLLRDDVKVRNQKKEKAV